MSDVDVVVDLMKQWIILADHTKKAGSIRPKTEFTGPADRNYQVKNKVPRKFLQWEDQVGMNIGWTSDAGLATAKKVQRWFFMRDGENESPIRYGELLALGNGKDPSWMNYESRTVGVNLQWHKKPSFEWKLLGGTLGQQIKIDEWLAIYNTKAKECFIYFERTAGGHVGWPDSKTWGQQFEDKLGDLAGKALDKVIEAGVKVLLTSGGG